MAENETPAQRPQVAPVKASAPLSPVGAPRGPEEGSSSIKPPAPNLVGMPLTGEALALAQVEAAREDAGSHDERESARSRVEGESSEATGAELVWVESALPDNRVALYERDPGHPDGEAFVGPGEAVEVARTGAVEARLAAGVLREASGENKKAAERRRASARKAAEKE